MVASHGARNGALAGGVGNHTPMPDRVNGLLPCQPSPVRDASMRAAAASP